MIIAVFGLLLIGIGGVVWALGQPIGPVIGIVGVLMVRPRLNRLRAQMEATENSPTEE